LLHNLTVETLADRLREATKALHVEVERTPFIRAMLKKQLPQPDYVRLLRNLYALYAALETALFEHRKHPVIAPIFEPRLFRAAAIERDLLQRGGERWSEIPLARAMEKYVARIRGLETSEPALLAAHVYVRSLGDLNGGRVLRRIVGGAFYDFGSPELTAELSSALRARLASLDPGDSTSQAIVLEAKAAFARHGELFAELEEGRTDAQLDSPSV
jgi:heme oxygenase